jgi:NTP pyrophosphatase (non-canonical NTP hydrolase)
MVTIMTEQTTSQQGDSDFQARVAEWMMKCFGADITNSLQERCFRFFEEAGELCQALGMTEEQARDLVAYTWSRDKGEPSQEIGGVMVTLAAMCHAAGLDMAADGEAELARIDTPETIDAIRQKHHAKPLRTQHSTLLSS